MCWKAAGLARLPQRHPARLRGQRRGPRCHWRCYYRRRAADRTRPPAARAPAAKCGWCPLRVAPGLLAVAARQAPPAQADPLARVEWPPLVYPRQAAHSDAATPPRPETGLRAAGSWRCGRGRWGLPWACGVWRDSGANATACPVWVEQGALGLGVGPPSMTASIVTDQLLGWVLGAQSRLWEPPPKAVYKANSDVAAPPDFGLLLGGFRVQSGALPPIFPAVSAV